MEPWLPPLQAGCPWSPPKRLRAQVLRPSGGGHSAPALRGSWEAFTRRRGRGAWRTVTAQEMGRPALRFLSLSQFQDHPDRGPGKGLFDSPLGYSLMQAGRGRCAEGVTLPPGGRLCSSAPAAELTGQKQGPGWRFLPRGALARVSWEEALAKARSPGHGPESEGRKGTPHRGSL